MTTLSVTIIMVMLVPSMMMTMASITSEKTLKEREKMTPFECGFSPFKKARSTFSLRFFMTTIMFLIFDIEIALLLPLGVLSKISNPITLTKMSFTIALILLMGLFHEWKQGALNWAS